MLRRHGVFRAVVEDVEGSLLLLAPVVGSATRAGVVAHLTQEGELIGAKLPKNDRFEFLWLLLCVRLGFLAWARGSRTTGGAPEERCEKKPGDRFESDSPWLGSRLDILHHWLLAWRVEMHTRQAQESLTMILEKHGCCASPSCRVVPCSSSAERARRSAESSALGRAHLESVYEPCAQFGFSDIANHGQDPIAVLLGVVRPERVERYQVQHVEHLVDRLAFTAKLE